MPNEKGSLSINSENILPIIKKWLYSDTDIFIRELVSNATDAITKLKKLVEMGEVTHVSKEERYAIYVRLDKEAKTISVSDNGIGMTADEIKQYINEIAFSGANDFVQKYGDKMDKSSEIIGHFGLGFYSAFMVAEKVQIDSLSYKEGVAAAKWSCDGGIEFELEEGDRTERGTTITLYVGEDSKDFLEQYKLREILRKYCGFIPVEIFFENIEPPKEEEEKIDDTVDEIIDIPEDTDDSDEAIESEEAEEAEEIAAPEPINDISPLWLKQPTDCTDEEYKEFYHKVFSDFNEPLFWIHLNVDYPFRLQGILYFPKLKHELESIEGQVKLYNNQVFIADNLKEVIPEFLLLLKGTIDCPDLPLNVSRSFLQNDGFVTKMSGYITKKVADKLNSIFKKDREQFNGYWEDISPFIKYGCIKEKDFYEKMKGALLFKTTNGDFVTLDEFLERNKDKTGDKVFYVSNEAQQAQYIKMFKEHEQEAVILSTNLDNPFISYLESYDSKVHFNRIDSDISETLKEKDEENKDDTDNTSSEGLQKLFQTVLANDKLKINAENLKSSSISAIILLSEQSRRMQEMSRMFGTMPGMNMFENEETLVLNKNNSLVKLLMQIKDDESKKDDVDMVCRQIYDLAMMSHKPLSTEAMTSFIERSNILMEKIIG